MIVALFHITTGGNQKVNTRGGVLAFCFIYVFITVRSI